MLLTTANFTAEHDRSARATAKLSFNDIKGKLQKVFCRLGDATSEENASTKLGKDEECKYTREHQLRGRRLQFSPALFKKLLRAFYQLAIG